MENKKFLISSWLNPILSRLKCPIVLFKISICFDCFALIKFGCTLFKYNIVIKLIIIKIKKLINKNFFKIERFFKK